MSQKQQTGVILEVLHLEQTIPCSLLIKAHFSKRQNLLFSAGEMKCLQGKKFESTVPGNENLLSCGFFVWKERVLGAASLFLDFEHQEEQNKMK